MHRDLKLLAAEFFDLEIPKDKKYLCHYFKSDLQLAFLRYYLIFENADNFIDHTGYYCSTRFVHKLLKKIKLLTDIHQFLKKNLNEQNMELITQLESGRYKIAHNLYFLNKSKGN